jgi:methionyl-tRNA formyltransferase
MSDLPNTDPATARLVFAGTPEFAVPSLRGLFESGYTISCVLTQPDRPAGRGRRLRPSPVKTFARQHDLHVMQPESLGEPTLQRELRAMRPDAIVVAAYGLLLPSVVLDIPRTACINIHASVLPRWRGASPVQMAILAGDRDTGVSIMRMEQGLDTGAVYAAKTVAIGAHETAGALEKRLAIAGADLLIDTLPDILSGSTVPATQSDAEATYARRIGKSDALIDWHASAVDIDRQIRAYNPWPVAYTLLDESRLRCWAGEPLAASVDLAATSAVAEPGTVVAAGDDGIDVQTGDGVLRISELQLPGKRRMHAGEFANGYPILKRRLG